VTELTSPDEQMLHDVGLARGGIEVCTAWRGDRVAAPMKQDVEISLHLKPFSWIGERRLNMEDIRSAASNGATWRILSAALESRQCPMFWAGRPW
jgi:hypothetical protein